MNGHSDLETLHARLAELSADANALNYHQLRSFIESLQPADVAHLLESSPPHMRDLLWNLVGEDKQSDIVANLGEDLLNDLLVSKTTEQLLQVLADIDPDDLTDILQQLPDRVTQEVLDAMAAQHRRRIENLMTFAADTAGGLMNIDAISVRPRYTLDVVLRYLRRHGQLPSTTDTIFVVNRNDEYVGSLPINHLLVTDPSMTVREVMITDLEPIPATLGTHEVAQRFERYDLVSAPVVDETGRLLGRITIDDVVDVIRGEGDHSLLAMSGLDQDNDTFAPILRTTRRRSIWLGANLLTAFLASAVINLFEDTIAEVVALAILMPIVASMGGVAGSQTLTLMIRSMAQGQIGISNSGWFLRRELAVGLLNGLIWALLVAICASAAFSDIRLGAVIAAALMINLAGAALAGASLPLLLRTLRIDPAIAGGVLLTTVTDVLGFLSFLGLATLVYA